MKPKSASRQDQICLRLKEVRELLGVSLSTFAEGVSISKDRLASYEQCRAPLRVELALRLCRRWVISEEWLATGEFAAFEETARKRGAIPPGKHDLGPLRSMAVRQCVDLFSDGLWQSAAPGSLFSGVYDSLLSDQYRKLVGQFFYVPRIVFHDDRPEPELATTLLLAYSDRWSKLIENESHRVGENPWKNQRDFFARFLQSGGDHFSAFLERVHPSGRRKAAEKSLTV